MPESKGERRRHFRGKARPGRRVEVRYRVLERGQLSEELRAHTKNIGVGGAFILTPQPAAPRSMLQISILVPASGQAIEVRGEVRWIVPPAGSGDDPSPTEAGMGIKFAGLDVDQLLALNEYFATLTTTIDHDEA